jgi:hypothetical protein
MCECVCVLFVSLLIYSLFFYLFFMIEEKNEKYSTINFKKEVVKEVEDPNMWSFDEDLMQNKKNLKSNKSEIFFSKTER